MTTKVMRIPLALESDIARVVKAFQATQDLEGAKANLEAIGVKLAVSLVEPQDTQRAA